MREAKSCDCADYGGCYDGPLAVLGRRHNATDGVNKSCHDGYIAIKMGCKDALARKEINRKALYICLKKQDYSKHDTHKRFGRATCRPNIVVRLKIAVVGMQGSTSSAWLGLVECEMVAWSSYLILSQILEGQGRTFTTRL